MPASTTAAPAGQQAIPNSADIGVAMNQIIDTSVANTTFVAEAPAGTAQTAAAWRVQKILVNGNVTTITWAGGASGYGQFDQVVSAGLSGLTYA